MSLECTECKRVFSIKSNLTRHLRMVHNIEIERIDILPREFDVYHYKCLEGCNISFRYNRELRKHLQAKHEINIVELQLEFPNLDDFHKWLHNEETNNYVQYVHLTAMKRKTTGTETYYYECNRTGKRNHVDDNNRKRRPRKWVAKSNHGCTSQIIVNKSHDGAVFVHYYKTHYGHDNDLDYVKLSKQDRGSIASRLLLGVPVSTVLNSVKKKTGHPKRINILAKKDISNIKRSFNIDLKDNPDNTINVNAFINDCSSHQYNPILYSNIEDFPESEEIFLIIMSKYQAQVLSNIENHFLLLDSIPLKLCDFELITLFMIGVNWQSFPVACMFTNKVQYGTYELFFDKIKQRIGALTPALFITNCNEMYYRAWENVMGATRSIYNPLHIDSDLKLNLNKVICNETDVARIKRKWIYDTLKSLQLNRDETDFVENFDATFKVLRSDRDFADFLEHFLEHYHDTKRWVECYRTDLDLPLEQLQVVGDVLRQYLHEGVDMRIDKIFHSLIRFIRDETVNAMLTSKANRILFINENDTRHRLFLETTFGGTHQNENLWTVEENGKNHLVQKYLEKKCCNLVCSSCNICVHCFSCSCVDFFVGNAICVHIHYIWVTYFQSIVLNDEDDEPSYDEEIIIEVDDKLNPEDEEVCELRNAITERSNIVCNNVTSVRDKKTLKIILDTLEQLCEVSANEQNNAETDSVLGDHSYL